MIEAEKFVRVEAVENLSRFKSMAMTSLSFPSPL